MDLNTYFLGARLFYWLYLLLTLLFAGGVVAYWFREWIAKKFYSIKSPEKLIRIQMFYPGNYFRNFYRLIPLDGSFNVDGGTYNYTEKAVYKNRDLFAFIDKDGRAKIEIEDKIYEIQKEMMYKKRFEKWPLISYIYGNPLPLNYESGDGKPEILFNSLDLERFKKSTILTQIYNSMGGDKFLAVILIIVLLVLVVAGLNLAQNVGWINLAKNVTQAVVKK